MAAGDNIKEKRAPRSWSEQEHNTFLEGLVLHGRYKPLKPQ